MLIPKKRGLEQQGLIIEEDLGAGSKIIHDGLCIACDLIAMVIATSARATSLCRPCRSRAKKNTSISGSFKSSSVLLACKILRIQNCITRM